MSDIGGCILTGMEDGEIPNDPIYMICPYCPKFFKHASSACPGLIASVSMFLRSTEYPNDTKYGNIYGFCSSPGLFIICSVHKQHFFPLLNTNRDLCSHIILNIVEEQFTIEKEKVLTLKESLVIRVTDVVI